MGGSALVVVSNRGGVGGTRASRVTVRYTTGAGRAAVSDCYNLANAAAATLHDPRFAPLNLPELTDTDIEVSLLSALEPLHFASEADALAQLRPNVDGVVFEYQGYRSTFLPQVWEQLPSAREFMAHLKRKAGLSADFWAADVRLQRYTVAKFKEGDAP